MMHSLSLTLQTLATVSVALSVPTSERRQLLSSPGADTYRGLTKGSLGPLAGQPGVDATYDYVVVGGGTSGTALGTRLAQAGHTVAIIEGVDYYEMGKPELESSPGGDFAFVGSDPSDADAQLAVAAFKRARDAFTTSGMQPVTIVEEYWPGSEIQTDAEILDTIQSNLMTVWHASCTNKMGWSDDPMAVVNSQARVFGAKDLRVVDASAFPHLPPGHPQRANCKYTPVPRAGCNQQAANFAIDMIAEKIADLIINSGKPSMRKQ